MREHLTPSRILVIGSIVAVFIIVFNEVSRGPKSIFSHFDRGTQKSYELIEKGMSKDAVFETLGGPRIKSDSFSLPQKYGFEHFFHAAESSTAVEYFQWLNGMNWYYCIGFDAKGEVVVKGEGSS